MGLYDELQIDKSHGVPKETGWQTKSLDCLLNTLSITETGELLICSPDVIDPDSEIIDRSYYTGEVRFYQIIDDAWCEYTAFFENGVMFELIKTS